MNQKNPERVCRWWIFNNSKSGVESIWRSDWWTFVSVVVRSIPSSERDVMWMKESSPAGSGTSVINLVKIRRIKRSSFQKKKTEQSWFYILIMIKKNCSFFIYPSHLGLSDQMNPEWGHVSNGSLRSAFIRVPYSGSLLSSGTPRWWGYFVATRPHACFFYLFPHFIFISVLLGCIALNWSVPLTPRQFANDYN